jgi:hypothetical protein
VKALTTRLAARVLAGCLLLAAAACAVTDFEASWRDPALSSVAFRKVLVAFQSDDEGLRRAMEEEMARDLPNAVPAYTVVPDEIVLDRERVEPLLRGEGFDSVVLMRIVGVEQEQRFVPGRGRLLPVPGLWASWHAGWVIAYEPGYLRTDRIVHMSTRVYSIEHDKLVWASQTGTTNPASLRAAIASVVRANARAAGLVLRRGA